MLSPFACHSERSEESLSFHAQGKLHEESMLFISNHCEMLRGVYPERGMKGILRCAQNDKRRDQHDISARFHQPAKRFGREIVKTLISCGSADCQEGSEIEG